MTQGQHLTNEFPWFVFANCTAPLSDKSLTRGQAKHMQDLAREADRVLINSSPNSPNAAQEVLSVLGGSGGEAPPPPPPSPSPSLSLSLSLPPCFYISLFICSPLPLPLPLPISVFPPLCDARYYLR